jgi:hypothetical protein
VRDSNAKAKPARKLRAVVDTNEAVEKPLSTRPEACAEDYPQAQERVRIVASVRKRQPRRQCGVLFTLACRCLSVVTLTSHSPDGLASRCWGPDRTVRLSLHRRLMLKRTCPQHFSLAKGGRVFLQPQRAASAAAAQPYPSALTPNRPRAAVRLEAGVSWKTR